MAGAGARAHRDWAPCGWGRPNIGSVDRVASAFKIAIVGSGPAGLSAAARAAQIGLSHVLLEKTDHLSDTIYKYQKGKHVMATPSQLLLRSDMDFEAGKREAVLGTWDRQAAEHKRTLHRYFSGALTALLPAMSSRWADRDVTGMRALLARGIRATGVVLTDGTRVVYLATVQAVDIYELFGVPIGLGSQ